MKRLLLFTEMLEATRMSERTFRRLPKDQRPRTIQLSERRIAYREEDIEEWLLARRVGALIHGVVPKKRELDELPTARQMLDAEGGG